MDLLQPVIRPYAWGSRTSIAELQGRPVPSDGPEAELWMGAHPSAPSVVVRDGRAAGLDEVIAAAPERELGADCAARFGGRLPFLLKVLAADKALSIQVHPSRAQAEAGFRADNERRLAPGDPARNYVDDWAKPELLCALTPFEVLAGMRSAADALGLLRALGVARLKMAGVEMALAAAPAASAGAAPAGATGAAADPVGCALATILQWPAEDRAALIEDVIAACARLAADDASPYAAACAAIAQVAADHPGDIGIVAALLLRHAVLEPGEAVFMPAGGLHAYLGGTGIELLANSDNVVRAGLTGKHIDVPELLKLLDPAVAVPVVIPEVRGNVADYGARAPEFRLYRADLGDDAAPLPGAGPRIVFCLSGCVVARNAAGETVKLGKGESCFVSAADGAPSVTGPARVFVACAGSALLLTYSYRPRWESRVKF
jgi:mannose-6-phosphate isomerase